MDKKDVAGIRFAQTNAVEVENIKSLIADLGSEDGIIRVRARKSLVNIGHAAVGLLVEALASKQEWVRWEAAKTLAQIGDPSATQPLVEALRDEMFDVRWLAAEGLIHIGNKAIAPILEALTEHPDSLFMREGAHHILHDIMDDNLKKTVKPVLRALEDVEPSLEVAFAAETALDVIRKGQP